MAGVGVLRQRRYACSERVWTVWLGWWELARVNCRKAPKWASIEFAREALAGVKHSSTRASLPRPVGALVGGQVVHDHVDGGAVGTVSTDRLQRGQGLRGALVAAVDAPRGVLAGRYEPGEDRHPVPMRPTPAASSPSGSAPYRCCPGARLQSLPLQVGQSAYSYRFRHRFSPQDGPVTLEPGTRLA